MTKNKIEQLRWDIFSSIIVNGTETSKGDILSDDPIENKVYTKRINIGKDYGNGANAVEVVCVSLTSQEGDKNLRSQDVRINTRNAQGKWCNIFIGEAPFEMLEFVHNNIPSGVKI